MGKAKTEPAAPLPLAEQFGVATPDDWKRFRAALESGDAEQIAKQQQRLNLVNEQVELALLVLEVVPELEAEAKLLDDAAEAVTKLDARRTALRAARPSSAENATKVGDELRAVEKDLREAESIQSGARNARKYLLGLRLAVPELFGVFDDEVKRYRSGQIPPRVQNFMGQRMNLDPYTQSWLDFRRPEPRGRRRRARLRTRK